MKRIVDYIKNSKLAHAGRLEIEHSLLSWILSIALVVVSVNALTFALEMNIYLEQEVQTMSAGLLVSKPKPVGSMGRAPEETNSIIVKYKDTVSQEERANIEKAEGLKKKKTIDALGVVVYDVSEKDTGREVSERIAHGRKNNIEYVEVDMTLFPAYIPNDPSYTSEWHIPKIQADRAWDTVKGDGVTIAVLDGGVNCAHPDLALNCVPGWNVMNNTGDTSDATGHGTMVSGTLASVGDNAQGGAGVSFRSKIMPVRIALDDGSSSCSAIANGIVYAIDHGAKIASNSYWVVGCTVATDAANYMASKGGVYVRAMGNDSTLITTPNDPNIIHVGATDSNDVITSWSNYGPQVDLVAPGIPIYCTPVSGGYGTCWGTSFSVPIVAGVFGLMYAVNPTLSAAQAMTILYSTADDLGVPGWDQYYGYGRVNAVRAVATAASTTGNNVVDTLPPSTPQGLAPSNITSGQVALSWQPATDNVGVTGYDIYRNGAKIASVSGTMYTNTALSPATTYTYTVAAKDAVGNVSEQSLSISVTTPSAPFSVQSSAVTAKSGTSASVAVSLNKTGTVTVYYGTSATALTMSAVSQTSSNAHQVTLTGLKPKMKYFYKIQATSLTGESAQTAVSNFRTLTR